MVMIFHHVSTLIAHTVNIDLNRRRVTCSMLNASPFNVYILARSAAVAKRWRVLSTSLDAITAHVPSPYTMSVKIHTPRLSIHATGSSLLQKHVILVDVALRVRMVSFNPRYLDRWCEPTHEVKGHML